MLGPDRLIIALLNIVDRLQTAATTNPILLAANAST
jgi:hypothetical protein